MFKKYSALNKESWKGDLAKGFSEAFRVLRPHETLVFKWNETQISTKQVIEDFRFHDLRHTWASWLIQSGIPLSALQEMGGWESIEMVRRYAHLAPNHLSEHARQIDLIFKGSDTITTQQINQAGLKLA